MENVDLRKCKTGDLLKTIHGTILIYVGPLPKGSKYDHEVKYPNGGYGTRTHNGQTYRLNRLSTDEDIAKIL